MNRPEGTKKRKASVMSIKEVIMKKRLATSRQTRSENNMSQSNNIVKTDNNPQFSFGERSSRDENGSVNMNKIDDAIQDLNDKDRRLSLRGFHTPNRAHSAKEAALDLKKQKSDMDVYNKNGNQGADADIGHQPFDNIFDQNKSENNTANDGGQVHSKNLSEYASIRVSIGLE